MADLRIVDAPEILLQDVEDGLKLPTGGFGNYAITMSTISDWLVRYKDLALKSYTDTELYKKADKSFVEAEIGRLGTASKYNVEDLPLSNQQKIINKMGGLTYYEEGQEYPLHGRVLLNSGDEVVSIIEKNTNNPNIDMTGWVNAEDTSYAYTDHTPLSKLTGDKADGQEVGLVLNSAAATQTNVLIDLNCTISTKVIIDKAVSFLGVKGKWITQNTDMGIEVTALGATIDKLNIDTNGNTYGIFEHGTDNQITNLNFRGNTGHYILSGGVSPSVFNCSHEKGYSQITPFVFSGAEDFEITKCLLDEYTGFGIQARWCKGGKIHDNTSNALFSKAQITTSTSTSYSIDLGKTHNRFGVTVTNAEGKEVPAPFNISAPTGTTYTVTLDLAPTSGRTLTLYGTDALESYQVNSGCDGVKIFDNTSNGSGDSNIVVGCDYRWNGSDWVLDPNNVTPSDEPINTTIDDNTCTEALYSNIAINHSQQHVQITNNKLSRAALCHDRNNAFNTNINCSADGFVDGNSFGRNAGTVLNNINCLRSGSVSNKVGRAGLIIGNKNNFSLSSDVSGFTPIFTGANTEAVVRRQGAIIEGEYSHVGDEIQKTFEAAFVGDMPVATDNFSFSNANGFLNKDTVNNVGGKNSVFINAGVTIDISAKQGMLNRLSNKIVRVRMFVSGNGSINFFPLFAGASTADIKINAVNESTFVQREIYFPTAQLNTFLIRLSTSNTLYIQDIDIAYLSI
ncbi:MAG: hypothetical protein KBT03_07180 [Bacteroidales bacterium]|nr:hypothetical protein [Candidatus Scybalousia scybalohippi]